ncbi:MAG: hypothetical protein OHK0039_29980 [Bacteroidia bacterium]
MKSKPFKSVVKRYKAVFFDAYGVLKNYKGLITGMDHTLRYLAERQIGIFVLTNDASRSPQQLADKFAAIGLPELTADKIISSGMLAREYLRLKVRAGRIAYLGTPDSAHYLKALGLDVVSIGDLDLDEIDDIRAVVFLDDEGFDWNHDLNKTINLLRATNIPVVVANTDRAYPVSKHMINIAIGGIADMMEDITGKRFIRFGKPDAQMFNFALEHVRKEHDLQRSDILMVGDTLQTDILGGNKFGLDTALVLTGNTLPDQASFLIKSTGIIPDYVCESAVID